jgi:hypothetical protein
MRRDSVLHQMEHDRFLNERLDAQAKMVDVPGLGAWPCAAETTESSINGNEVDHGRPGA